MATAKEKVKMKQKLKFKLSEADKVVVLGKLVAARDQIMKEELELSQIKDKYKDKITALNSELNEHMVTAKNGYEMREVECIVEKDFAKCKVRFVHKGKVIEERDMTVAEKQRSLELQEKKPAKKETKQESIAAVIKDETSKKTKVDASAN